MLKMILVNTDYISGKELEMLGLVKGSTIQTKNIGRDTKILHRQQYRRLRTGFERKPAVACPSPRKP